MTSLPFYLSVLRNELSRRKSQNSRYSMRAFAAHLQMHPSMLSRVLAQKQVLAWDAAMKIVEALNLSPDEVRQFLNSVLEERRVREEFAMVSRAGIADLRSAPKEDDALACAQVFNLEAIALLQLAGCTDFREDHSWISKRLGLAEARVAELLPALSHLGLLRNRNSK